jgi:hypothetical protein
VKEPRLRRGHTVAESGKPPRCFPCIVIFTLAFSPTFFYLSLSLTTRSHTMGDKGGKKNKNKSQKQIASKHEQKEQQKHIRQQKGVAGT